MACLCASALTFAAGTALAQDAPPPSPSSSNKAGQVGLFLLGGALGLGLHESGHVIAGAALGANPGIKGISFGFIPFFAITHDPVSPPEEYTISSAGFWMQAASSEWILTKRPGIRQQHAPVAKGILAFHVAASVTYGIAAFGRFGPPERDTRSMAESLRVSEPWVGALVIAPGVLDSWRYMRPDAAWAKWASRATKVAMVLLVVRAAQ